MTFDINGKIESTNSYDSFSRVEMFENYNLISFLQRNFISLSLGCDIVQFDWACTVILTTIQLYIIPVLLNYPISVTYNTLSPLQNIFQPSFVSYWRINVIL